MEMANISSRGSCDFISKLPDPILHHILGLLNTKEAVQTCVLSKRWEYLWTFLPSLNFNFTDFRRDDDDDDDDDDDFDVDIADRERFVKFVNTVLLRRETLDMDVFRLSCKDMILYDSSEDEDDEDDENDWIRYAMNHNTRVLHLSPSDFPWSTYTCTSLQKLYLYSPSINSLGQKVNLPNLKQLSFFNAYLLSDNVKNFLSGSPKLEFLRVDDCRLAGCTIAHEHLKYVVLARCHIDKELFVSAPNLLSFSCGGELSLQCKTTLNMPSLSFAHIMSWYSSMMKCLKGMVTCLRYLTNVELLELHFERVWYKVLHPQAVLSSLELPIFHKLENMTVGFGVVSCFKMVTLIIKNSPNLKKLTILQREECLSSDEMEVSTNELTRITSSSSTIATASNKKLEIVEVKYFIYDEMIRRLVNTLIDGTKESKNLKIHLSKYESSKQYLNNERLSFTL